MKLEIPLGRLFGDRPDVLNAWEAAAPAMNITVSFRGLKRRLETVFLSGNSAEHLIDALAARLIAQYEESWGSNATQVFYGRKPLLLMREGDADAPFTAVCDSAVFRR